MERLTMESDKGGVAFTFDLDVSCEKSEIIKILRLAEKLKYYEDLEERGLLLKLPCRVGDVVYCAENKEEYSGFLFMTMCGDFVIVTSSYAGRSDFEDQLYEMEEESMEDDGVSVNIFHKDKVFLTQAEAEKALAEMEAES